MAEPGILEGGTAHADGGSWHGTNIEWQGRHQESSSHDVEKVGQKVHLWLQPVYGPWKKATRKSK